MKRRVYYAALWVALGTSSAALAATLVKGPYLQNLTTDGVTVMWETDEPASGRVEYGAKGNLDRRAEAKPDRRIQEVRLTGLEPERAYAYRVVVGQTQAGPFEFRTAVKRNTPYRFAVYGDNRSHPDVYAAVVALLFPAAAGHRPALVQGMAQLWRPEVLLFFQGLALVTFLYTGRSQVTGATVRFHVRSENC